LHVEHFLPSALHVAQSVIVHFAGAGAGVGVGLGVGAGTGTGAAFAAHVFLSLDNTIPSLHLEQTGPSAHEAQLLSHLSQFKVTVFHPDPAGQ